MQKSPRPHACSTNAHAQELYLSDNSQLGDDGATALASLLSAGKLAGTGMGRFLKNRFSRAFEGPFSYLFPISCIHLYKLSTFNHQPSASTCIHFFRDIFFDTFL